MLGEIIIDKITKINRKIKIYNCNYKSDEKSYEEVKNQSD